MAISLKKIKLELERLLPFFDVKAVRVTIPGSTNQQIQFSGLYNIRKGINTIANLGLFKDITTYLTNTAIYTLSDDSMNVQISEGTQIKASLDALKELINNFVSVLESIVPNEDPNSINIKLPNAVDDFSKLSEITKDINFALTQLLSSSDIGCDTKIVSVENGSIWTNVQLIVHDPVVQIPAAITFIKELIKAAIKIRKEWLEGTKLKEEILKLKRENQNAPDTKPFEDTIDQRINNAVTEEANKIKTEYFKKSQSDHEELERIKAQLKTLTNLLEKGVIITPSISSDEDTRANFPSVSEQLLLDTNIKEIRGPEDNYTGE